MPRGKDYVILEDMQAVIDQSIARHNGQLTAQLSAQITDQTALIAGKVDSLKSVMETRLNAIEADVARAKKNL